MLDLKMMTMMRTEEMVEMLPENPVTYGQILDVKKVSAKVLSSLMASHTGSPVMPAQSSLRLLLVVMLAETTTRGEMEQRCNSITKYAHRPSAL